MTIIRLHKYAGKTLVISKQHDKVFKVKVMLKSCKNIAQPGIIHISCAIRKNVMCKLPRAFTVYS